MTTVSNWTTEELYIIAETAYELHLQGMHSDALTIVDGLLAIDPRNIYCLDAAAALSLALGRPERALEYASSLLTLSPYHKDAIARRCEAHILLGRLQEVRDDLQVLKHTGANALYRRITMRLMAVSRASLPASDTESFEHLSPITG